MSPGRSATLRQRLRGAQGGHCCHDAALWIRGVSGDTGGSPGKGQARLGVSAAQPGWAWEVPGALPGSVCPRRGSEPDRATRPLSWEQLRTVWPLPRQLSSLLGPLEESACGSAVTQQPLEGLGTVTAAACQRPPRRILRRFAPRADLSPGTVERRLLLPQHSAPGCAPWPRPAPRSPWETAASG